MEQKSEDIKRMAHKNSFTVLSSREEKLLDQKEEEIEQDLEELDDEDFFRKYREMRMKQWKENKL